MNGETQVSFDFSALDGVAKALIVIGAVAICFAVANIIARYWVRRTRHPSGYLANIGRVTWCLMKAFVLSLLITMLLAVWYVANMANFAKIGCAIGIAVLQLLMLIWSIRQLIVARKLSNTDAQSTETTKQDASDSHANTLQTLPEEKP
jgi:hypothetical protein